MKIHSYLNRYLSDWHSVVELYFVFEQLMADWKIFQYRTMQRTIWNLSEKLKAFWKECIGKLISFSIKNKSKKVLVMVLNTSSPTTVRWLEEFEKYVFDIVKSIKFRNGSDNFQNKLRSDTLSKKSSNMFIFAGKTSKI